MSKPVLMQRTHYVPVWSGVFEKWSRDWVNKHFWRVRNVLHTREDAMQECAVIWAKCAAYYAGKIDNGAWFMSVYKQALARHWHTLSSQDTACPERYANTVDASIEEDQHSIDVESIPEQADYSAGFLSAQIACASSELKEVFFLLANAPSEVINIVFSGDDDATTNRLLSRWLRFTRKVDVVAELREILSA